jgi:eukaryotic-like serine/threonine-protein kinase
MHTGIARRQHYHFGSFEVDVREKTLRKNGVRLHVQPKPFTILLALLENPGQLVTREQLRQLLWPADTFVDFERGLNSAVTRLRQTLGDSADTPRFIATEAKLGYRFIAPVAPEAKPLPPAAAPLVPRRTVLIPRILGAFVLFVLGVALVIAWPRGPRRQALLEQLTTDRGLSTDPALSPDGKLLVYSSNRGGHHLNLWLRQLTPDGTEVQLTHLPGDAHQPSFSPDGDTIVFRYEGDGGGLYTVPTIGGKPAKLTSFGRDPRYSPNGRWIAFWSSVSSTSDPDPAGFLYILDTSVGNTLRVGPSYSGYPIWAPDSKTLLVARLTPDGESDWWTVPTNGDPNLPTGAFDQLRRIGFTIQSDAIPRPASWDGANVLFSAQFGDSRNLWRMPVELKTGRAGKFVDRLTFGTTHDSSPNLSSNGQIIYASLTQHTGIWSVPLGHAFSQRPIERITQTTVSEFSHSVTTDGSLLAYTTQRYGPRQVQWRSLLPTKVILPAPPAAPSHHPQLSPDGSLLAFSGGPQLAGIYTLSLSQGLPERIAGSGGIPLAWAPDQSLLLFTKGGAEPEIWSVAFPSRTVSPFLCRQGVGLFHPRFTPDGRFLAVLAVSPDRQGLVAVPLRQGRPAQDEPWIPLVEDADGLDKPTWSQDGATLYFLSHRDGFRCIWSQRVHPDSKQPVGAPTPVRHFHDAALSLANVPLDLLEIAVTPKFLLVNIGELSGNIWITDPQVAAVKFHGDYQVGNVDLHVVQPPGKK